MANYRSCVFCNRNDSRPTKEDIFANWIVKEFPNFSVWEAVIGTGPTKYKTKHKFGYVTKKVCGRCNNGWMSKLESDAKQVIPPLIHGERVTLTWDKQLCIAKWFMKTTLMCDVMTKEKSFFTLSDRQAVMQDRVPRNTWVWLACYRGQPIGDLITRTVFVYEEDKSPNNQDDLLNPDGYTFTLLIKHLALQVFSFRVPKDLVGQSKVSIPARWEDATVQIPLARDAVWPPRLVFDDAGFEEFAGRWGELGLIL